MGYVLAPRSRAPDPSPSTFCQATTRTPSVPEPTGTVSTFHPSSSTAVVPNGIQSVLTTTTVGAGAPCHCHCCNSLPALTPTATTQKPPFSPLLPAPLHTQHRRCSTIRYTRTLTTEALEGSFSPRHSTHQPHKLCCHSAAAQRLRAFTPRSRQTQPYPLFSPFPRRGFPVLATTYYQHIPFSYPPAPLRLSGTSERPL
jgi:hypothetical protein